MATSLRILDATRRASRSPLSPEAVTACTEIEKRHPDLYRHLRDAEKLVPAGELLRNARAATRFSGYRSGCIWFSDPEDGTILLGDDWALPCMDESVWLPLITAFPTLFPMAMTGTFTNCVALKCEKRLLPDLRQLFEEHGESLDRHCVLRKGDSIWILFSCDGCEKRFCKRSDVLPLGDDEATIIGSRGLVPVFGACEWKDPPEGVENDNENVLPLPAFLVDAFMEPES